jgi:thioredoxin-related protein
LIIGFSTKDLRDSLQVVGQPITIVFDTNGDIESRQFGYIP